MSRIGELTYGSLDEARSILAGDNGGLAISLAETRGALINAIGVILQLQDQVKKLDKVVSDLCRDRI